jgi:replicative DNA helicase
MIEDKRGLNIDRLSMLIRSTAARSKLGLVCIDYLGLIAGDRKKPRWESVSEISNQLKTIAQTESIPILALCQLSRDSEGEVPKLSHLRDSGSIEQDADIVLLLHRESRTALKSELFVAKNRNGPIARIELSYTANRFEFQGSFDDFRDHR